MKYSALFLLTIGSAVCRSVAAQSLPDTVKSIFTVSAELRPRTEFRSGYKQLRSDTMTPAFFTDQRSRLTLDYNSRTLSVRLSVQDVRVWGEQQSGYTTGSLQAFEVYAEPRFSDRLSLRIGRQRIVYDNQRLFGENNWNQAGAVHDAARLMYRSARWEGDLIGAFSQPHGAQGRLSGTDYPSAFPGYKVLGAVFLKCNLPAGMKLTLINVADGYQDTGDAGKIRYRYTSGGRVEHSGNDIYLTLAGYYQYGKNSSNQRLSAFYFQPEIKYTGLRRFVFSAGGEVFSGDNAAHPATTENAFEALYGANHRFLGAMDYFSRDPRDARNAGLISPYLYTQFALNKKWSFRSDEFMFYNEHNLVADDVVMNKFLGFEQDLLVVYKPVSSTEVQLGYSYLLPTKSMEYIKHGNSRLSQSWAFLMITFSPELFRWEKAK